MNVPGGAALAVKLVDAQLCARKGHQSTFTASDLHRLYKVVENWCHDGVQPTRELLEAGISACICVIQEAHQRFQKEEGLGRGLKALKKVKRFLCAIPRPCLRSGAERLYETLRALLQTSSRSFVELSEIFKPDAISCNNDAFLLWVNVVAESCSVWVASLNSVPGRGTRQGIKTALLCFNALLPVIGICEDTVRRSAVDTTRQWKLLSNVVRHTVISTLTHLCLNDITNVLSTLKLPGTPDGTEESHDFPHATFPLHDNIFTSVTTSQSRSSFQSTLWTLFDPLLLNDSAPVTKNLAARGLCYSLGEIAAAVTCCSQAVRENNTKVEIAFLLGLLSLVYDKAIQDETPDVFLIALRDILVRVEVFQLFRPKDVFGDKMSCAMKKLSELCLKICGWQHKPSSSLLAWDLLTAVVRVDPRLLDDVLTPVYNLLAEDSTPEGCRCLAALIKIASKLSDASTFLNHLEDSLKQSLSIEYFLYPSLQDAIGNMAASSASSAVLPLLQHWVKLLAMEINNAELSVSKRLNSFVLAGIIAVFLKRMSVTKSLLFQLPTVCSQLQEATTRLCMLCEPKWPGAFASLTESTVVQAVQQKESQALLHFLSAQVQLCRELFAWTRPAVFELPVPDIGSNDSWRLFEKEIGTFHEVACQYSAWGALLFCRAAKALENIGEATSAELLDLVIHHLQLTRSFPSCNAEVTVPAIDEILDSVSYALRKSRNVIEPRLTTNCHVLFWALKHGGYGDGEESPTKKRKTNQHRLMTQLCDSIFRAVLRKAGDTSQSTQSRLKATRDSLEKHLCGILPEMTDWVHDALVRSAMNDLASSDNITPSSITARAIFIQSLTGTVRPLDAEVFLSLGFQLLRKRLTYESGIALTLILQLMAEKADFQCDTAQSQALARFARELYNTYQTSGDAPDAFILDQATSMARLICRLPLEEGMVVARNLLSSPYIQPQNKSGDCLHVSLGFLKILDDVSQHSAVVTLADLMSYQALIALLKEKSLHSRITITIRWDSVGSISTYEHEAALIRQCVEAFAEIVSLAALYKVTQDQQHCLTWLVETAISKSDATNASDSWLSSIASRCLTWTSTLFVEQFRHKESQSTAPLSRFDEQPYFTLLLSRAIEKSAQAFNKRLMLLSQRQQSATPFKDWIVDIEWAGLTTIPSAGLLWSNIINALPASGVCTVITLIADLAPDPLSALDILCSLTRDRTAMVRLVRPLLTDVEGSHGAQATSVKLLRSFITTSLVQLSDQFYERLTQQKLPSLNLECEARWFLAFARTVVLTLNLHDAMRLVFPEEHGGRWALTMVAELLSLSEVGCEKLRDILTMINVADKESDYLQRSAALLVFSESLTILIGSSLLSASSVRRDSCAGTSPAALALSRVLEKCEGQYQHIFRTLLTCIFEMPTPESALRLAQSLTRVWGALYDTMPSSLHQRRAAYVLKQLLMLDLQQDDHGQRSHSFKVSLSHAFGISDNSTTQTVEKEEQRWAKVTKCLITTGVYPLLEGLDEATKRYVFGFLSEESRQRFQKYHSDVLRYHSFKAQAARA